MKYFIFVFIFFINFSFIISQKQDYIWLGGYDYSSGTQGIEGFIMDFKYKLNIELKPEYPFGFFRNNASIADKDGNLLMYSNGCAIMNRNHEMMPNGDSINAGEWYDKFWINDCSFGYPGAQDLLLLDDPKDNDSYYLLHKPNIYHPSNDSATLYYSYLDLDLDNGFGDVIKKNVRYYPLDNVMISYSTAIRHKNRKDWWLIHPKVEDSVFITFLIDENGISRKQDQNTNQFFNKRRSSASGMAKFSPDGSKYALYNYYDQLHIYDFDRAKGLLTNHQKINIYHPDSIDVSRLLSGSVEWSSDSRFLYTASQDYIHQVDTWENDIEASNTIVATYNGAKDPLPSKFSYMSLGPDCRIYITPPNGSFSYSIINKPNEKGVSCGFVQNAIKLPWPASGSFPNFPRFRVDEIDKCDPTISSIFGDDVHYRRDIDIYPNPSLGLFNVRMPEAIKDGYLIVTDIYGKIILQSEIHDLQLVREIDITAMPSGNYNIEIHPKINPERVFYGRQVVKI